MNTPSVTVSIEVRNPTTNETTTIKKGPFNVNASPSLPKQLLHLIVDNIGTYILGLNSNPKSNGAIPLILFDDMLMFDSEKFKCSTLNQSAFLQTTIKSQEGNFTFTTSQNVKNLEIVRKQPVYPNMLTHETYEILTPNPPQQQIQ